MLATPINEALFSLYYEMPTYLGPVSRPGPARPGPAALSTFTFRKYPHRPNCHGHLQTETVDLITEGGRRYANVAGELQEVVIANKADVNSLSAKVCALYHGRHGAGRHAPFQPHTTALGL